jgi:hypothetical protein
MKLVWKISIVLSIAALMFLALFYHQYQRWHGEYTYINQSLEEKYPALTDYEKNLISYDSLDQISEEYGISLMNQTCFGEPIPIEDRYLYKLYSPGQNIIDGHYTILVFECSDYYYVQLNLFSGPFYHGPFPLNS